MLISLQVFKDNHVVDLPLIISFSRLMLLCHRLVSAGTILMGHCVHSDGFLPSRLLTILTITASVT